MDLHLSSLLSAPEIVQLHPACLLVTPHPHPDPINLYSNGNGERAPARDVLTSLAQFTSLGLTSQQKWRLHEKTSVLMPSLPSHTSSIEPLIQDYFNRSIGCWWRYLILASHSLISVWFSLFVSSFWLHFRKQMFNLLFLELVISIIKSSERILEGVQPSSWIKLHLCVGTVFPSDSFNYDLVRL